HLPYPARPGGRRSPRLRHHPGRHRPHERRTEAQRRDPVPLHSTHARAGACRRNARPSCAGRRRRAPALLPDHAGRGRGRQGRSAPARAAGEDGARRRVRDGEDLRMWGAEDVRIYNLLLRVYPASFRNEYAEEMRAIFARRLHAAGPLGVIGLWLQTIPEVIGNAAIVHWDLLRQDLSYTARMLRRAPGFAGTAIAIVALGIG